MADELIDVFNDRNEPLGRPLMKSEVHRKGLWHRASSIWIYNSKGEILLQLRATQKNLYPNVWDVCAGHIAAGEEPIIAAVRELEEEIGLWVAPEALELYNMAPKQQVYKEIVNNEFEYIYILLWNGSITQLTMQKEEVAKIQFFNIDTLKQELETTPHHYAPPIAHWFEMIEEIRSRIKK